MRPLLACALLLSACGPDRRAESATPSAPSASTRRGPDQIVLRVPRSGGVARAYLLSRLDSVLWSSASPAPALAEVLGFDPNEGSLAYVDARGIPRRLDLRLGGVAAAAPASAKLTSFASADGSSIFALGPKGNVVRLASSGEAWSFAPPPDERVGDVFPQDDGTLVAITRRGVASVLWRLQPPADRVLDTTVIAVRSAGVRAQVGDRIYFGTDSGLVGVRARTLEHVPPIAMLDAPRVLVSTPSGDRIFVLSEAPEIRIVDRYRNRVAETIQLPAPARSLRMDALGRYLLVQPDQGDFAWVVAVGTSRVLGAARTRWLPDLPLVTPDGALLLAQGADVVLADAETMRERRRVENGASDFWSVISWNGFRPRAAGLDEPVHFATTDSVAADTTDSLATDSASARPDSAMRDAAPPAAGEGYVVSFASFPSEARAREIAGRIRVRGQSPRIVPARIGVTMVYRVILGPYPTRADAESVGRESGHSYWVFEATP